MQRTAILSNEKYRGIRLTARPDLLTIQAHNPEQEEAEDQVEVTYKGEEVEIGFNVNYLLDALGAIEGDKVEIGLTDSNSSCLIHASGHGAHPLRRDADAPVAAAGATAERGTAAAGLTRQRRGRHGAFRAAAGRRRQAGVSTNRG